MNNFVNLNFIKHALRLWFSNVTTRRLKSHPAYPEIIGLQCEELTYAAEGVSGEGHEVAVDHQPPRHPPQHRDAEDHEGGHVAEGGEAVEGARAGLAGHNQQLAGVQENAVDFYEQRYHRIPANRELEWDTQLLQTFDGNENFFFFSIIESDKHLIFFFFFFFEGLYFQENFI